ncbi:hypothetical protein K493DRAFT_98779 [Basidiobolus meristosporus CBS 931.73]|uniref:RNA-binding domain-containing protein n=1 Tax=Basidiobolus meristosporus CBS 931.73 TaxID=1314790 RepID=A0A1Y1X3B1_9FUNG|nr:hypothetical protein K493DRAFT_98779 [Basidiobolus meristosporus CBS 931.73]|eukprot:ORX80182.1 hypothetical protein K493DRAFT_98779 [Basidiobolus meristosporus CBS 931.73]
MEGSLSTQLDSLQTGTTEIHHGDHVSPHAPTENAVLETDRGINKEQAVNGTGGTGKTRRLPRNEYRKLKKKLRKRAIRQELYQLKEQEIEETEKQKEARIIEEQEHDRQRLLWELRDKEFDRVREEELKRERIKSVSEKVAREIASRALLSDTRAKSSMVSAKEATVNAQPPPYPGDNDETEKESTKCPFYLKTGACRYGNLCSREHPYPTQSKTILIKNMYVKIPRLMVDEESDDTLEFDEAEAYKHFENFFEDVHTELLKFGKIDQLKVCSNELPHLDGNVYVQYATSTEAASAVEALHGRWYAGKQLTCELVAIESWNAAICGMAQRQQCPKGKDCNFLHVYRNPGNLYPDDCLDSVSAHSLIRADSREAIDVKVAPEGLSQQARSPDRYPQDPSRRSESSHTSRSRKRNPSRSRSPSRRRTRRESPSRRSSHRHRSRDHHRSRSSRHESSGRTRSRSRDRHRSSR